MMKVTDNIQALTSSLWLSRLDFEKLLNGKNNLTPLETIELFLTEQQRLRTDKQNLIRRKRANLPNEKTIDSFDFGFQRSISKEQTLRLSDMTRYAQAI